MFGFPIKPMATPFSKSGIPVAFPGSYVASPVKRDVNPNNLILSFPITP